MLILTGRWSSTVEGHELAVLSGLSQPVPLVSFEVNLPDFRDDAIACIHHLAKLGSAEFNYINSEPPELRLPRWQSAAEFIALLSGFTVPSIDVFACHCE